MEADRNIADVLGTLKLFADLSRPQLEAAVHTLEEDWYSEGQRILRQGLTGSGFHIILEGEAAVKLADRDVAKLGRGDFFGEISVLLGEPPTADVVALGPLRCVVLPGPLLQEFLETNPKVMFRMLQAEAGRLRNSLRWEA